MARGLNRKSTAFAITGKLPPIPQSGLRVSSSNPIYLWGSLANWCVCMALSFSEALSCASLFD